MPFTHLTTSAEGLKTGLAVLPAVFLRRLLKRSKIINQRSLLPLFPSHLGFLTGVARLFLRRMATSGDSLNDYNNPVRWVRWTVKGVILVLTEGIIYLFLLRTLSTVSATAESTRNKAANSSLRKSYHSILTHTTCTHSCQPPSLPSRPSSSRLLECSDSFSI